MFCPNCGTELPTTARFCMKCGQPIPTSAAGQSSPADRSDTVTPTPSQQATQSRIHWYERKRNFIGIAVLSFFLYAYVIITTLARATLKGNEALYIAFWTSLVFYVVWKRKGWKGWVGALVGFLAGFALVFLAAAIVGLTR